MEGETIATDTHAAAEGRTAAALHNPQLQQEELSATSRDEGSPARRISGLTETATQNEATTSAATQTREVADAVHPSTYAVLNCRGGCGISRSPGAQVSSYLRIRSARRNPLSTGVASFSNDAALHLLQQHGSRHGGNPPVDEIVSLVLQLRQQQQDQQALVALATQQHRSRRGESRLTRQQQQIQTQKLRLHLTECRHLLLRIADHTIGDLQQDANAPNASNATSGSSNSASGMRTVCLFGGLGGISALVGLATGAAALPAALLSRASPAAAVEIRDLLHVVFSESFYLLREFVLSHPPIADQLAHNAGLLSCLLSCLVCPSTCDAAEMLLEELIASRETPLSLHFCCPSWLRGHAGDHPCATSLGSPAAATTVAVGGGNLLQGGWGELQVRHIALLARLLTLLVVEADDRLACSSSLWLLRRPRSYKRHRWDAPTRPEETRKVLCDLIEMGPIHCSSDSLNESLDSSEHTSSEEEANAFQPVAAIGCRSRSRKLRAAPSVRMQQNVDRDIWLRRRRGRSAAAFLLGRTKLQSDDEQVNVHRRAFMTPGRSCCSEGGCSSRHSTSCSACADSNREILLQQPQLVERLVELLWLQSIPLPGFLSGVTCGGGATAAAPAAADSGDALLELLQRSNTPLFDLVLGEASGPRPSTRRSRHSNARASDAMNYSATSSASWRRSSNNSDAPETAAQGGRGGFMPLMSRPRMPFSLLHTRGTAASVAQAADTRRRSSNGGPPAVRPTVESRLAGGSSGASVEASAVADVLVSGGGGSLFRRLSPWPLVGDAVVRGQPEGAAPASSGSRRNLHANASSTDVDMSPAEQEEEAAGEAPTPESTAPTGLAAEATTAAAAGISVELTADTVFTTHDDIASLVAAVSAASAPSIGIEFVAPLSVQQQQQGGMAVAEFRSSGLPAEVQGVESLGRADDSEDSTPAVGISGFAAGAEASQQVVQIHQGLGVRDELQLRQLFHRTHELYRQHRAALKRRNRRRKRSAQQSSGSPAGSASHVAGAAASERQQQPEEAFCREQHAEHESQQQSDQQQEASFMGRPPGAHRRLKKKEQYGESREQGLSRRDRYKRRKLQQRQQRRVRLQGTDGFLRQPLMESLSADDPYSSSSNSSVMSSGTEDESSELQQLKQLEIKKAAAANACRPRIPFSVGAALRATAIPRTFSEQQQQQQIQATESVVAARNGSSPPAAAADNSLPPAASAAEAQEQQQHSAVGASEEGLQPPTLTTPPLAPSATAEATPEDAEPLVVFDPELPLHEQAQQVLQLYAYRTLSWQQWATSFLGASGLFSDAVAAGTPDGAADAATEGGAASANPDEASAHSNTAGAAGRPPRNPPENANSLQHQQPRRDTPPEEEQQQLSTGSVHEVLTAALQTLRGVAARSSNGALELILTTVLQQITPPEQNYVIRIGSILQHTPELYFVVCSLLGGKTRAAVQRRLGRLGIVRLLGNLLETQVWFRPDPFAHQWLQADTAQQQQQQVQGEAEADDLQRADGSLEASPLTTGASCAESAPVGSGPAEASTDARASLGEGLASRSRCLSDEGARRSSVSSSSVYTMPASFSVSLSALPPPSLSLDMFCCCETSLCAFALELLRLIHDLADYECGPVAADIRREMLTPHERNIVMHALRVPRRVDLRPPLIRAVRQRLKVIHPHPLVDAENTRKSAQPSAGTARIANSDALNVTPSSEVWQQHQQESGGGEHETAEANVEEVHEGQQHQRPASADTSGSSIEAAGTHRSNEQFGRIATRYIFKGTAGLLSRLICIYGHEPPSSVYKFWLASSIEACIRGADPLIKVFAAESGLLQIILRDMHAIALEQKAHLEQKEHSPQSQPISTPATADASMDADCTTRSDSSSSSTTRPTANTSNTGCAAHRGMLQSCCDLMGELLKFNPYVLLLLDRHFARHPEAFRIFVATIEDHLIDTNVLVRSLFLTFEFCRQIARVHALAARSIAACSDSSSGSERDGGSTVQEDLRNATGMTAGTSTTAAEALELHAKQRALPLWRQMHFFDRNSSSSVTLHGPQGGGVHVQQKRAQRTSCLAQGKPHDSDSCCASGGFAAPTGLTVPFADGAVLRALLNRGGSRVCSSGFAVQTAQQEQPLHDDVCYWDVAPLGVGLRPDPSPSMVASVVRGSRELHAVFSGKYRVDVNLLLDEQQSPLAKFLAERRTEILKRLILSHPKAGGRGGGL
ncbi:hypothetical protein cyc_03613 [Cyclospora cayetanensis]|uniref:Uncharacterized protein n=1 Tax=Cyclospora cayetanensis TaxID=88456 RepID=A0A1D3CS22_9EIME|nr:hypothetical protein cyc_03613 [Cyclospora cayetanensis]